VPPIEPAAYDGREAPPALQANKPTKATPLTTNAVHVNSAALRANHRFQPSITISFAPLFLYE
jgi:hypothetical protein